MVLEFDSALCSGATWFGGLGSLLMDRWLLPNNHPWLWGRRLEFAEQHRAMFKYFRHLSALGNSRIAMAYRLCREESAAVRRVSWRGHSSFLLVPQGLRLNAVSNSVCLLLCAGRLCSDRFPKLKSIASATWDLLLRLC